MTKLAEQHPMWKGDKVGYMGAHAWLRTHYNYLKKNCEHCNGNKNLQFAKKSESEYTRNIEDYLILCQLCHLKYDGNFVKGCIPWNKGIKTYRVCDECKEEFYPRRKSSKFCSNVCSGKYRFRAGLTKLLPGMNEFNRLELNKK